RVERLRVGVNLTHSACDLLRHVEGVFVGEQEFVEPRVGGVRPIQLVALVGVLGLDAVRGRRGVADIVDLVFVAELRAQLEAVAVGRLEVQFSEEQVLPEWIAGRAQLRLYIRWQQILCSAYSPY